MKLLGRGNRPKTGLQRHFRKPYKSSKKLQKSTNSHEIHCLWIWPYVYVCATGLHKPLGTQSKTIITREFSLKVPKTMYPSLWPEALLVRIPVSKSFLTHTHTHTWDGPTKTYKSLITTVFLRKKMCKSPKSSDLCRHSLGIPMRSRRALSESGVQTRITLHLNLQKLKNKKSQEGGPPPKNTNSKNP